jgi:hypothetical protein
MARSLQRRGLRKNALDGTSIGFVYRGQTTSTGDTNNVKSITVHN